MSRSGLVVPNIFANQGSGPTPVSQIDTNFTTASGWLADSSNGYGYWLQDSGTANNYIVTYPAGLAPSSLTPGFWFVMNPLNANTGTSVVTINSLPAASIVNPAGLSLIGGEISPNSTLVLMYTGTTFTMVGACPYVNSLSVSNNSTTLNVAGYTTVSLAVTFNVGGSIFVLSHLGPGVPITIVMVNNQGATGSFAMDATSPSGVRFGFIGTCLTPAGGGFTNIQNGSGFLTLAASSGIILSGASIATNIYLSA